MKLLMKISLAFLLTAVGLFLYWYAFIALEEMPMEQGDILEAYQYPSVESLKLDMTETRPNVFSFTYESFDGAVVYGQISYAVISIDARYHGKRKDPDRTLRSIMNDVHFFGDKRDYEAMVRDTVLDHRVLLDWIEQQDNLDIDRVKVAGYSMGGQIGLILGSVDARISDIISIVPPFIDDKLALVAPKNLVSLLGDKPVLLITAADDENASAAENDLLFELMPGANKERIDFNGGHILPEGYVNRLKGEFEYGR